MRISIVGGGPAGLYLALLLRQTENNHEVTIYERNRADETFGWGVVFSDATLENLAAADPISYQQITREFAHWDDIDIHFRDRTITSSGHGFSGIARRRLLNILQERATSLGVEIRYQTDLDENQIRKLASESDLLIGADGVNSRVRRMYDFGTDVDLRSARFIWFGTTLPLDAFTFIVIENEFGVFQVHAYRFEPGLSTFIVECDERSWQNIGWDKLDAEQSRAACETMFAQWLQGHPLLYNGSHQQANPWQRFLRVKNERWSQQNVVLIGDAAHTAHFSIGSGTKLAMEDAIALARNLNRVLDIPTYEADRKTEALKLQNAARNSMEWFENVRRYVHLEPEQFAYSLLTRSQRVSHENLRLRDRDYLEGVERWFAGDQRPPAFTPYTIRNLTLNNRICVSPMDTYCATDGTPNDFHLVHLGARALGGAGLVFTEMTCVTAQGRITPGCTGMYAPEHVEAWKRVVAFVREWSNAKLCLQLGHAGRKGSTKLMWEGMDDPLDSGNWPVIGPSPIPYKSGGNIPREMNRADMEAVKDAFIKSTEMARACDFDMIELHCAHGYLLSSFITPVSNQRTDEYGGSLQNRLRYPLEVFNAIREVWGEERPVSIRISATDWLDGGISGADAVVIARAFIEAGADIIHVSTGQTSPDSKPVYGRMFQTPFSDWIRNEARVPTIAVGNITEIDQVNSIIAAGRADLVALGRPHLSNPNWTLHAAAELGWRDQPWPPQYYTGKQQLERLMNARNNNGR